MAAPKRCFGAAKTNPKGFPKFNGSCTHRICRSAPCSQIVPAPHAEDQPDGVTKKSLRHLFIRGILPSIASMSPVFTG